MLKNQKNKELIFQSIAKYNLNLEGYNVLVPVLEKEPLLLGVIAGMAGAKNVYVFNPKLNINEKQNAVPGEFNFDLHLLGSLPPEILPNLNVILKNNKVPLKKEKSNCLPLRDIAVSVFPENMDFLNPQDPDLEVLAEKKIPVVRHNPDDQRLDIYQQFANIIIKRCHYMGIDVFRSKILLVGHGNFLNTTLGILKSLSSMVYVCNTGLPFDQSYILKHLKDIDLIIAMDYPLKGHQIVGSKGLVQIGDIVDLCPFVRILQVSGEVETGSLKMGGVRYYPAEIIQENLNLSIYELGERGLVELGVNCLKLAETHLKVGNFS